jgi:hypothetical protein
MQAFNFRIHKLYSRPTDFKINHQSHRLDFLDNLLFVISGICVIIWAVGFWSMDINAGIHILLIFAANLMMLGIIQHQKIREKNR